MIKIKTKMILKAMRVHHYLKNFLIFLPLLFSGNLFQAEMLLNTMVGFIAFSLAASTIYIINDIRDVESDRLHEIKSKRPIASGAVSIRSAKVLALILVIMSLFLNYLAFGTRALAWIIILTYIFLNMMYSLGLKNIPLLDISILVSGFLLRVIYGSAISSVIISNWLYLTVISLSFYLALGKRRNEIKKHGNIRQVSQFYSQNFLDRNMYVCLGLTITFYALWCVDPVTMAMHSTNNMIWTVMLVLIICMKYSLQVEGDSQGDPVDVFLGDKTLIGLVISYALIMFIIIYCHSINELAATIFLM
ncbi:UbiA prenyltransferase family protein [Desulfosporosinus nitroreducens]|uniref:UbiA prenyltransferase family protein n=1 Tax=Desulfosporosinus nitroreducens TaxID=2018668 RepID=UPI00207D47E6|nr:UbiA prenyltransferase family protein [Desulfosporosinus nitroreducens]MCO1602013.1 UbiA prenyltransferase family protein [Desulfosporosinus nitroreducens]